MSSTPAKPDSALDAIQANLNAAAERIWEASSPACPQLSIEVLPEIGSTNTELLARGRRGDTSPTLLVACRQTAGRGRQGRTWQAALGDSLTFSLGWPMDLDKVPGGGSALSLAVGLAVAQALDDGLNALPVPVRRPTPVGLKWPNDLWLDGRKLGGILIEASPAPGLDERQRWVVIGVGLNIREGAAPMGSSALLPACPAHADSEGATRLLTPGQVWSWVAPALIQSVQAFASQGFAPLQFAYSQRDVLSGQPVGLWTTPGQGPADGHPPSQTGLAQGVSETGALLVHTDEGRQSWTTGEVSVRLRAP